MKKSYIVAIAIALVVVIVGGLFIVKKTNNGETAVETTTEEYSPIAGIDSEAYTTLVLSEKSTNTPILKTSISGIFYTMTTDGAVTFFKLENSEMTEIEKTGEYDVTVTCAYQDLTAKVAYYTDEESEKTVGYGLFVASDDPDVLIYEYAFFYLTDLPESFAKSNNMLILVDTDKEDFYSSDKVYEEPFYYNTSSGAATRFLSADNRAIDDRGAPRYDYCMLTEETVENCSDEILFFSARHYRLFSTEGKLDIMQSGSWGNNTDNVRYIEDTVGFYAMNEEDGVHYFARTENGFELRSWDGENDPVTIHEFYGDFYEDYILSDGYLLAKADMQIYNLATGKRTDITAANGIKFEVDLFAAGDDGSYFIRGRADTQYVAVVIGTAGSTGTLYLNDSFKYIISPEICGENILLNFANDDEGTSYTFRVWSFI